MYDSITVGHKHGSLDPDSPCHLLMLTYESCIHNSMPCKNCSNHDMCEERQFSLAVCSTEILIENDV